MTSMTLPLRRGRIAQRYGAQVRLLQRGDRAHQRRLAGAVGSEEAVHPARDVEVDVTQSAHAVGVRLGDAADGEVHRSGSSGERAAGGTSGSTRVTAVRGPADGGVSAY